MPERTNYAPGTPSWVDIGTDVEPAKAFYTSLFDWTTQEAGPPEETGGYGFFLKAGSSSRATVRSRAQDHRTGPPTSRPLMPTSSPRRSKGQAAPS